MATLTASSVSNPMRAVHAGLQAAVGTWTNPASVTFSASATTVYMVRIPHKAVIYSIMGFCSSTVTAIAADVGRVGALDEFGSATVNATFNAGKGLPYTVSATTTGYEILTYTPTVTSNVVRTNFTMRVLYAFDAPTD
jgi:hypothetical protein